MHILSIAPGLTTLCYYGNGHFLLTKDIPTSKLFVLRCRLEAQQDREAQMERKNTQDKTDFIILCYRGLCLQGLNPVYKKIEYIYGSLYIYINIYIYTYNIQLRFNFKATANLFIL